MRLQTVVDSLVGYDQCGFMAERQMDFQIQRFRTVIDKMKVDSELLKEANIILVDLTKAFDRISHDYLAAVLDRIGLGTRFKRILMLVTTQQFAAIFTNNTQSDPFPLRQGTRQGNPVLPILFNLCLEPLLTRLKDRLEGIPVHFDNLSPIRTKYAAFADDLTIFVNSRRDQEVLKEELASFEQVSNSLVSASKSRLCYWGEPPTEEIRNILGFPGLDLSVTDHKYLGVPINGFNWERYIQSLSTQLMIHSVKELPVHLRCTGFNTYIYSKIYPRDLHHPMKNSDFKLLIKMIKTHLPQIGSSNLHGLKKRGGFGLINLEEQVQGRRAKVVYETLTNTRDWNLIAFRDKIQTFVNAFIPPASSPYPNETEVVPWYLFLVEIGIQTQGPRLLSKYQAYAGFSNTEKDWLKAWFRLTKAKQHYTDGRRRYYTSEFRMSFDQAAFEFMVRNPPDLKLWEKRMDDVDSTTFRQCSRKHQQNVGICTSDSISKQFNLSTEDYQQFWEVIYKIQLQHPKGVEEIRRVHLGHRDYHDTSEVPVECKLCLQQITTTQFFHHTYQNCQVSRIVRTLIGPQDDAFLLQNYIGNSQHPESAYLSFNQYLHAVHSLRLRRTNEDRVCYSLSFLSSWVSVFQARHY